MALPANLALGDIIDETWVDAVYASIRNVAWGVVAIATITAAQTGLASGDVTGATLTFTAVAGRRYRYTYTLGQFTQQGTTGFPAFYITDAANAVKQQRGGPALAAANNGYVEAFTMFETPPAGPVTRKVRASTSAGTLDLLANATSLQSVFVVEDVGPVVQTP